MTRRPHTEPHEEAYLELVERYETAILNYIYRMVGDMDTAEDLTQDTFVKAYRARHGLDLAAESADRRRAWLYRIAHNTAADHLRRGARIRWLPLGRTLAHPSADPEPRSLVAEPVRRALASLTDEQREVLHLFLETGLAAQEVADVLGVSPAAARKRLQRARVAFEAAYSGPQAPGTPAGEGSEMEA